MTQTVEINDLKDRLSKLVAMVSCEETRVLVEQAGVPVAALVSTEDLKQLARLDAQRAERRSLVESLREPFRGVPPEEIERETAKAVAEACEETRIERTAAAGRWSEPLST